MTGSSGVVPPTSCKTHASEAQTRALALTFKHACGQGLRTDRPCETVPKPRTGKHVGTLRARLHSQRVCLRHSVPPRDRSQSRNVRGVRFGRRGTWMGTTAEEAINNTKLSFIHAVPGTARTQRTQHSPAETETKHAAVCSGAVHVHRCWLATEAPSAAVRYTCARVR